MKPNSLVSQESRHTGEERSSSRTHSRHPLVDCHFRAPAAELQRGGSGQSDKQVRPVFAPGFRDLSRKFFRSEARRHYVAEGFFFAIIVGISAWPIVLMVQALAQLTK